MAPIGLPASPAAAIRRDEQRGTALSNENPFMRPIATSGAIFTTSSAKEVFSHES
jgi:hypothetical protein